MIYQEPTQQRARPPRPENTYSGLGAYAQSGPVSKFGQRAGESDQAFVNRLRPLTAHLAQSLPADELATVVEQFNSAVQRLEGGQSHQQLRTQLDSRQAGTGRGVFGTATPQARATMVGRFGGRDVRADGHLAAKALTTPGQPAIASASDINATLAERERARMGQEPQRTDVGQLRSTGTGFVGVNR